MDFNHLYARHQISLIMAQKAASDASRADHLSLADGYLHQIALLRNAPTEDDDRDAAGTADAMHEQAASYRRLAKRARTSGGADALIGMAELSDKAARRATRSDAR